MVASKWLFVADDGVHGQELWITDGTTAGTSLVKDTTPGSVGYANKGLVALTSGKVLFTSYDSVNGWELWISDGTEAGTTVLKDIYPGSSSSNPGKFIPLADGKALFTAANGSSSNYELWITDGTAAGTGLLKEINTNGTNGSYTANPINFLNLGNGKVIFSATDGTSFGQELWVTDGTSGGTVMVKDIRPGNSSISSSTMPPILLSTGKALFGANDGTHGIELWVTDGTAAGTLLVKDIYAGTSNGMGSPWEIVALGDGRALFAASDADHGKELWITDGTEAGTRLVKDVLMGTGSGGVHEFASLGNGKAVFTAAGDATIGSELWVTDGTEAGTFLLKDIWVGSTGGVTGSDISDMASFGTGKALFCASNQANGAELWITDGTASGTYMLKDISTGAAVPGDITDLGNGLALFEATDMVNGRELWITDGTTAGTRLIKDIVAGTGSSMDIGTISPEVTPVGEVISSPTPPASGGTPGPDTLVSGDGVDTLIGGLGNDTYIVNGSLDQITENAGEGTDLVQASATYTLAANLENLTLTGSADIDGTGNSQANTIQGNDGANRLDGAGGADLLKGGKGNDTYVVDLKGTTAAALEDTVTELANEGDDTLELRGSLNLTTATTLTLAATLEHLDASGTGSTKLNLTGNAAANRLTGNTANNLLDGKAGADTLVGGAGDDTYLVDNPGDTITEALDEGTDLVKVAIATANGGYTLAANVENGLLTNTVAFNLTGNGLANTLTGNGAANVLDGGAGADTLVGGAGNDTYVIDDAGDSITDSAGIDTVVLKLAADSYTLAANLENVTVHATAGAMAITGNGLANGMTGGSGDDTLAGGLGNDTLTGGTGADSFLFNTVPNGTSNFDRIGDFVSAIDRFLLDGATFQGIGAAGLLGAEAFAAGAGRTTAQSASERVIYNLTTGMLYFDADGNGTGKAPVAFAQLASKPSLVSSDFMVLAASS